MYAFTSENWTDKNAAEYAARLSKMDDVALGKQIEAGEFLCRPHRIAPRQAFVEQLRLARQEKQRRAS